MRELRGQWLANRHSKMFTDLTMTLFISMFMAMEILHEHVQHRGTDGEEAESWPALLPPDQLTRG